MADIIIVEDERVAAWNIQAALEKFGYTVVANVASGEKAVLLAETLKPDLVLMDICLPGEIDGIEAATKIRNRFHIPIVYLTAHTDDKTISRAIATDPYGYLIKPFKRTELHTTITTALRRCQSEKQLEATQQWLASTLNSIGDGTITTDREGHITFINPVAEAITGWQKSEAIGKHIDTVMELYHNETRQAMENPLLQAMREGFPVQLPEQCLLRTRVGQERNIDDVATPIRDRWGQVTGGVVVFRDITERQRMQAALRESDARFQMLAANLPGVIYRLLRRLDGSVEFLYVSPGFRALFEMDWEFFEQGGEPLQSLLYSDDDVNSLYAAVDTALQTFQSLAWEGRILLSSGTIKWIQIMSHLTCQENGEIIFDGLIVDISDRKRTEQALQKQMQREQLLAELAQQIHKSLDLHEILNTVVTEVRQILQVDRVLVIQLDSNCSGVVIQESVDSALPATLGLNFNDECFLPEAYDSYWQGQMHIVSDTTGYWSNCLRELMQNLDVKSKVVIPILQHQETSKTGSKSETRKLWGLLIVNACYDYRQWQSEEVDLLRQISHHLAIALHQSELYQELQLVNQQLEYLVTIDGLTQVANRRRFDEYLQQQWNQLVREQQPLSLILCDIDYFKLYNDTYGHPAGDICLVQIAQAITYAVQRSTDLVARYGGEEFAIILPNTYAMGAAQVAITIQNQIHQLQVTHNASEKKYVTLSQGIASTVPNQNNSPQALIAAADLALYQAKQQGRDRYCIVEV
ncbi:MAG: diguanylate cyclase [Scytonema sp. PMC 1069.18]|nr:diguanylate cyclase [Scytonema sp. PMC 1069.18]MEC4882044.1 diguanylate cyclase [Scytonema sp. PMC 1070.18]